MQTIALLAQKGDTGKTTLVLSIATAAERAGVSSLVIDLDPQATACNWSDRRDSETPLVMDAQPARLPRALDKAKQGGLEFAIIDTPARSEQAALAAAKSADLVIVPCRPQVYDLETIPNTRDLIQLAGDKPALAVLNAIPPRGSRHEQATEVLQKFGMHVCPVTIGQRAAFGDAGILGKTVMEYEPSGKAAQEILSVFDYICNLLNYSTSGEVDNAESRLNRRTG